MFHLHRFEHHQPLAGANAVPLGHIDRDDLARHRGEDRSVARREGTAATRREIELVRLPVGKHHDALVIRKAGQGFEGCGLGRIDRREFAALAQRHGQSQRAVEAETGHRLFGDARG